jgi:succinate-semialdehyde dehydrogenase/glutarate-semialdehyde dehydrogenase
MNPIPVMFQSINPATGLVIGSYPLHSPSQVEHILEQGALAQRLWRARSIEQRCATVRHLGKMLLPPATVEAMAHMATAEMGKTVAAARAEVQKCATVCEYYAQEAPTHLADQHVSSSWTSSSVVFEPLGVVLSIMPWNFPYWQFFRFAVPAIAAGNGVLLKHAPTTQGCATLIEDVCRQAGLPDGLVANLCLDVADVANVIADVRIHAVTFTGSTRGGKAVAAIAGSHAKKCVLELGGSDPAIVLDDADLDTCVADVVAGRMQNNGQSCIAAKRWIVHDGIYDEFRRRAVAAVNNVVVGNPLLDVTQVGPLARADLRESLHHQVQASMAMGARIITEPQALPADGFYVAPAILDNVTPGMPAFDDELFGPVAALVRAASDAEAVRLANTSIYGLGAAVYGSVHRARAVAAQLDCGQVFINAYVRSDPRLPFGGVKQSGYGRELGSFGIREFVNAKTIVH